MHGTAAVDLAEFEAGALTGDPGLQMCTGLAAAGGEVGAGAQQGAAGQMEDVQVSAQLLGGRGAGQQAPGVQGVLRSEEHTSELQSRGHLVCRLLLKKKNRTLISFHTILYIHDSISQSRYSYIT